VCGLLSPSLLRTDLIVDKEDPSYKPTIISILDRPMASPITMKLTNDNNDQDPRNKKHRDKKNAANLHGRKIRPTSQELVKTQGTIDHKMMQDAEVDIYISSQLADYANKPLQFALWLEELGGDEEEQSADDNKIGGGEGANNNKGADHHLSHLETEMRRIEHLIHTMLAEADLSKDRDSIYHKRTDARHQATIYWPIMHVGILLITGFAQANHIVRFFKKRRII
jgi:hypothetical protein